MKPTLSKYYNHDPRHYKFNRTLSDFQPIESYRGVSNGDYCVAVASVIIAVVALLVL